MVKTTLRPRGEHSLSTIEGWLKLRLGRFIRAEFTNVHIRLIWQQK